MADKMYDEAVKRRSERKVILLAGGAASGKSEYVATYLTSTRAIILDGTLPTTRGAEIKIEKAIKQQKDRITSCVTREFDCCVRSVS